jgi:hypothetical protein
MGADEHLIFNIPIVKVIFHRTAIRTDRIFSDLSSSLASGHFDFLLSSTLSCGLRNTDRHHLGIASWLLKRVQ